MTAASARPGYMAKREEKNKFDRYPRINLVPFILESTGRPGYHARKFIKHLYDNSSGRSLRDRYGYCATHATLLYRLLFLVYVRPTRSPSPHALPTCQS